MNFTKKYNTPLISLIIPVYNVRSYLYNCLYSVINQTYTNLNIIIIDDGSTDGSGKICDTFANKYPSITVFHTENRGLSAACNYGLDHINPETEYIAFLDSDDWMEKDAIQKLYNAASKHNADMVACRYWFEKPRSRKLICFGNKRHVLTGDAIKKCYIGNNHIGQVVWNKLYRKELFSGLRYPEGMIFEDVATTCKVIKRAKKVVAIPDILVHYRVRQSGLSKGVSMKCIDDYWKATSVKYKILNSTLDDSKYSEMLTGSCFDAINRMWRRYGAFSREEKKAVNGTIDDMMNYAAKYRSSVWRGHFTLCQKMTSLCVMSRNPIYMWLLNRVYRMVCAVGKVVSPYYK